MFVQQKHKEPLVSDKDAVAKQIKNRDSQSAEREVITPRMTMALWDKSEVFWGLTQYLKKKKKFHAWYQKLLFG